MKKFLLLAIIMVSSLLSVNAESKEKSDITVIGHVINKESGEHIPYATIAFKGTTIGVTADGSGHYHMTNVPQGEFTVVASSIGYKSVEKSVTLSEEQTLELNFQLKEESLSVGEIIVSSSRREENRRMAPTVVNIIGDKVFETTGASTISESLNYQPGLRLENTCNNCGAPQLRINGLEGAYSQILMNSRPIFSALNQVYGLEQIPTAMVERVEVVRGGGSALFGPSAIGGVVNIITKEPTRNSFSVSNLTNFMGDSAAADITNSLNGSLVSSDYRSGAYIYAMTRDREAYDRNGDGFSELVEIDMESIGMSAYHKISPYSKLTLNYHHISEYRRGGDSFDLPVHEAEIAEMLDHSIHGGGLTYDYYSPNYKNRLSLYTSFQHTNRESYFGGGSLGEQMESGEFDEDGLNALYAYGTTQDVTSVTGGSYAYSFEAGGFSSDVMLGVEYTYNKLEDSYDAYGVATNQEVNTFGTYLQNEWKSDLVSFIYGFRVDTYSILNMSTGNTFNDVNFAPRANIRYTPIEGLGLRLSYSSGYRAPQAYSEDLHIESVGGAMVGTYNAEDLEAEISNSVSASIDYYRTFGRVEANLLVEGFYTKLNNAFTEELIEDEDGTPIRWERSNAEGAIVRGLNAELRVGIPSIFDIQAGYTFQKSHYTEAQSWVIGVSGEEQMLRSPDHYGYFNANFDLYKNLELSAFGTMTGSMLVEHAAGYIEEDTTEWTDSFFDMGMQLSYTFDITSSFKLQLQGGVKNIFDQYQSDLDVGADRDAGYIYGPILPRTYFVGVKMSF
ncbi:MAG: TonB-dependent receptor [Rikenellaceae bacterium]